MPPPSRRGCRRHVRRDPGQQRRRWRRARATLYTLGESILDCGHYHPHGVHPGQRAEPARSSEVRRVFLPLVLARG